MKKYRLSNEDICIEEKLLSTLPDIDPSLPNPNRVPLGVEVDENRIYFYCALGDQEALELNRLLRRLDVEMQYLGNRLDCKEIPIHLHIQSPGGSLFAGLSVVDTIRKCKTPVYSYVDGSVASAASLISITAKKRFISENSFMLIHQPQIEWAGKYVDFLDETQNQEILFDKILKIYLKSTKLTEEKLRDLLKHELWLDAEKCLELGLADKVL